MRTALVFPGQGSQRAGMLCTVLRGMQHPAATCTFAEASDILARDWRELDTEAALEGTEAAQLSLLIAGVAVARVLSAEGAHIDAVLGHSIGAYPAAVAAGCLSFKDALGLVRLRGSLMARSHPAGFGMAVIVGLRERVVAELIAGAQASGPLYIANRNAPLQIVVSGSDASLARACADALKAGATKAERLAVATPSHSPLLAPVAEELLAAVRDVSFSATNLVYVSARRARVLTDAAAIADDLARNAAEPVLWHDAAALLVELGARLFLQAPPGTVLADLIAQAHPGVRVLAIDSTNIASALHLAARPEGPE